MLKTSSILLVAIGLASGAAIATQPDGIRYVLPLICALSLRTILQITRGDR